MSAEKVIDRALAHLAETTLGGGRVCQRERLAVGMEADVYAFSVESGARYVLKLFSAGRPEIAQDELQTMEAIAAVGLRCPRPIAMGSASSFFGRPFVVMEKIEGPSLKSVYYASSVEEKPRVMETFCRVFSEIHQADWRPARGRLFRLEEGNPYSYLLTVLAALLTNIKKLNAPSFVPVWNWLGERVKEVPCLRPAIIHGDFHPGNVLLPPGEPPVIIDWGGAVVGDPRRDLAWTLLLVGAYEQAARDLILDVYVRQSGSSLESFEYFEVLSCLMRLLFILDSRDHLLERLRQREDSEKEVEKMEAHVRAIRERLFKITGIYVTEVDEALKMFPQAA